MNGARQPADRTFVTELILVLCGIVAAGATSGVSLWLSEMMVQLYANGVPQGVVAKAAPADAAGSPGR